MRAELDVGEIYRAAKDMEGGVAEAATEAMRETTYKAVRVLRRQVVDAGLGQRLANTWRDRVYPERRRSMAPSGYIRSNAPDIIDSFSRGATIVPLGGQRFLAIPSDAVPNARGARGATRKMTPAEVEVAFNQDLFALRGKAGRILLFVNAVRSKNGQGYRQGTKRRLAQGRAMKPVLMFTLVPNVRVPKALDIDAAAEAWAADFSARFGSRLEAA